MKWIAFISAAFIVGTATAQERYNSVAERVNQRMVKVFGSGGIKGLPSYGTGILVSADGYFLTAASPLLDTRDLRVHLWDGRRYHCKMVVMEPELDIALATANHVFNTLPSATGTKEVFNTGRFSAMKRGAIFYNVGRGDTVDQTALRSALDSRHIAAAYLDVTMPEPLPADHPLWSAPNCFITPHIAGGAQGEMQRLLDHFLANFQRFRDGKELINRIM